METLSQHAENFLRFCRTQKRLSPATLRSYSFDMENFLHFLEERGLGSIPAEEVSRHILEAYVDHLSSGYATKTIKRRLACLRSFFNYLEYEEVVSDTPFLKFRMQLREPFHLPNTMSLAEVNKILHAAYENLPKKGKGRRKGIKIGSEEFICTRDVAVLELLFAGGLRVSELCGLCFPDLDRERTALLVRGKGGKDRLLYLANNEVIRALNNYLRLRRECGNPCQTIFITKFGGPLSTQAVRNLVAKYTREAGLRRNITPHVFRHTFASLLLEEGVDIKYIQEFLGHSSISTTQIYLHTTGSKKKSIMSSKHPRQKLSLEKDSEDNVKLSSEGEDNLRKPKTENSPSKTKP